jgi:glycine oxidase
VQVTVVGGGVIGLSCAWRLAQRGAQVTLYESRESLGFGATVKAVGALWPPSPLARKPLQNLQRQSLWQFERFIDDLLAAASSVPFDRPTLFTRIGRLELLNSPKAAQRAEEEAHAARNEWPDLVPGKPIMERVSQQSLSSLFPTLAAPHHGALLCRATAMVSPPLLITLLHAAAERAAVHIHLRTTITDLSHLKADAIFLTTGAWTRKLLPELGITPAKGQALALQPPLAFSLPHIVKFGPTYLIPRADRILIGSTTEPEAGFDETPTNTARTDLLTRAAAIFPELAAAKILDHWAGLRPDAPDHQPLMGKLPNHPNIFIAAGHYKTGIALAPLVSQLMTTLILDQTVPPELTPFSPLTPKP